MHFLYYMCSLVYYQLKTVRKWRLAGGRPRQELLLRGMKRPISAPGICNYCRCRNVTTLSSVAPWSSLKYEKWLHFTLKHELLRDSGGIEDA